MLTILLLIPLLGILSMLLVQPVSVESNTQKAESSARLYKDVALGFSIVNFFVSLVLWANFDRNTAESQFVAEYNELSFCHFTLGVDGISLFFILLTCLLFPIIFLADYKAIKTNVRTYQIIMLLLETLLIAVFTVKDILLFYIFFESILPPLFLLIGLFGSSKKVRASFHLFLYTLFGSLAMLLAFLTMYYLTGSTDIEILTSTNLSFDLQKILWLAIFFSFMIKFPLVPFHLWLPLAHSEAPLGGSILLAGVVLKLALYGSLRILIPLLPEATVYFTPLVYTIGVITIIYASLTTLRQIDMKVIIAYSSIGHVAIILMGAFSNNIQGIEGSILLGIAHGFISPALFIITGGCLYERYHTRVLSYYRGLSTQMPLFSVIFMLATLGNIAVPLSSNFVGEWLCLAGAFERSPIMAALAASGIFLSAAYSIWFYNRVCGGAWSPYLAVTTDLSRREFYVLLPLIFFAFGLGIFPNVILDSIHYSVSTVLYQTITP
uniref:NADH-ubiquinone oxidoreductase chain 4 n=1 Tax=Taphrina deformans JCM 22205 TaxID=1450758 RepID=A0A2Z5RD67_9ASCO|nr:NADH dehydrogenase subunit 4 [Taphrina deformans JCM 22205]